MIGTKRPVNMSHKGTGNEGWGSRRGATRTKVQPGMCVADPVCRFFKGYRWGLLRAQGPVFMVVSLVLVFSGLQLRGLRISPFGSIRKLEQPFEGDPPPK